MSENPRGNGANKGGERDPYADALRLRSFGEELLDRGDLTAAAEVITRALILFLNLEEKDEVATTERLLTKVVPRIGPFAYAEIRRTVEIDMGVRPPEPPREDA